jgi:hypothetical protein
MAKKMWQFKTRNFTVRWLITPDVFDAQGLEPEQAAEWRKDIRAGRLKCFLSEIQVVCNATGIVLGEATLGNSLYDDPAKFRDHFGITAKGFGSYFLQMVKQAVKEARERFPAHQAAIAREIRKKQPVVGVKLKAMPKSKAKAVAVG